MKCPYCGRDVADSSRFCTWCGNEIHHDQQKQDESSRRVKPYGIILIVLAVVLILAILAAVVIVALVRGNRTIRTNAGYETDSSLITESTSGIYLQGQVTDGAGQPLEGVQITIVTLGVSLENAEQIARETGMDQNDLISMTQNAEDITVTLTTDSNGSYTANLPEGVYQITYELEGYGSVSQVQVVTKEENTPDPIILTSNSIITGNAYFTEDDGSVTTLGGVTVTAADADGNIIASVVTSETSGYTFELSPGTYQITAEADGFETVVTEVSLNENDVINTDFEMVEAADELIYYGEILDLFYYNILSDWEGYEATGNYGDLDDVCYLFYWAYAETLDINSIGYSFADLDGNGILELIIGIDSGGENRYTDGSLIYDLYTYADGRIIHLASSGERFGYELCEDNTIYYNGSAGAASARYARYSLTEGEDELTILECVWSDPDDSWENTYWYYSTSDFYGDDTVQISEAEAYAILDSWPQTVSLTLTPFSSYTPADS